MDDTRSLVYASKQLNYGYFPSMLQTITQDNSKESQLEMRKNGDQIEADSTRRILRQTESCSVCQTALKTSQMKSCCTCSSLVCFKCFTEEENSKICFFCAGYLKKDCSTPEPELLNKKRYRTEKQCHKCDQPVKFSLFTCASPGCTVQFCSSCLVSCSATFRAASSEGVLDCFNYEESLCAVCAKTCDCLKCTPVPKKPVKHIFPHKSTLEQRIINYGERIYFHKTTCPDLSRYEAKPENYANLNKKTVKDCIFHESKLDDMFAIGSKLFKVPRIYSERLNCVNDSIGCQYCPVGLSGSEVFKIAKPIDLLNAILIKKAPLSSLNVQMNLKFILTDLKSVKSMKISKIICISCCISICSKEKSEFEVALKQLFSLELPESPEKKLKIRKRAPISFEDLFAKFIDKSFANPTKTSVLIEHLLQLTDSDGNSEHPTEVGKLLFGLNLSIALKYQSWCKIGEKIKNAFEALIASLERQHASFRDTSTCFKALTTQVDNIHNLSRFVEKSAETLQKVDSVEAPNIFHNLRKQPNQFVSSNSPQVIAKSPYDIQKMIQDLNEG